MPSARPGTMSGALARLCAAVEPGGRVVRVRRLHGGLANLVHAVDLRTASGERRRWVVRRRPQTSPAHASGPYTRLWQTLGLLEDAAVSAPRRVWHDPAGGLFGAPTVVVTRFPGRSLLAPRNLA